MADKYFLEFLKDLEDVWGKEHIKFNHHLLAHLAADIRRWGPIYSFWCFGFERFNGSFSKMPSNMKVSINISLYIFILIKLGQVITYVFTFVCVLLLRFVQQVESIMMKKLLTEQDILFVISEQQFNNGNYFNHVLTPLRCHLCRDIGIDCNHLPLNSLLLLTEDDYKLIEEHLIAVAGSLTFSLADQIFNNTQQTMTIEEFEKYTQHHKWCGSEWYDGQLKLPHFVVQLPSRFQTNDDYDEHQTQLLKQKLGQNVVGDLAKHLKSYYDGFYNKEFGAKYDIHLETFITCSKGLIKNDENFGSVIDRSDSSSFISVEFYNEQKKKTEFWYGQVQFYFEHTLILIDKNNPILEDKIPHHLVYIEWFKFDLDHSENQLYLHEMTEYPKLQRTGFGTSRTKIQIKSGDKILPVHQLHSRFIPFYFNDGSFIPCQVPQHFCV